MQSQADDATSCTEPAFTFMSDLQRSASQARAPGLDPAIDGKSSTLRQRSLWVSCFGQCVSCWQARQGANSPQKPPRRGAEAASAPAPAAENYRLLRHFTTWHVMHCHVTHCHVVSGGVRDRHSLSQLCAILFHPGKQCIFLRCLLAPFSFFKSSLIHIAAPRS